LKELQNIRIAKGELGTVMVMRLGPSCDLMKSIKQIADRENIRAGLVLSGAGSLSQVTLRNVKSFPDEFPITDRNRVYTPKNEPLELVSLSGNISEKDGEAFLHCHITVSSGLDDGKVFGGHLIEGCIVYSTCEVIIVEIKSLHMKRNTDAETHAFELYPESK
jgi:predicted DNA-binding protein with PD1-like motif